MDPYPAYRALREAGPLHWSNEFFGGAWMLTRHADVESVLRDPRFSAQRTGGWVTRAAAERGELAAFQKFFSRAFLFLDPPEHTRLRGLMLASFRPDAMLKLRSFIEETVDELLDAVDAVENQGEFDFMDALARPLPVRVISRVMGLDGSNQTALTRWSNDLAVFIGSHDPSAEQARRAQYSLLAMVRYLEEVIAAKRLAPGDDMISQLIEAERDGSIRDHAELLAQCAMMLFAGHETTRNLLGNGMLALLRHPDQWKRLQGAPELLPSAVREMLRYDSPVQYTGRRVTTDLELHGKTLRRGDLVITLIGAANRDPARHDNAEQFDIGRKDPGALAFGSGIHVCIGAALTRLEAEVVFGKLLERASHWQLAAGPLSWKDVPLYRGLEKLAISKARETIQS